MCKLFILTVSSTRLERRLLNFENFLKRSLERKRGFGTEATPTVNLCRIAPGYASEMNLLISALGNWMFSKVCSRHLLLHLSSQIAQPQHIPLYENYITAKNQWLHQTQQRRVWFLPWSQTVSSKNPLVSITYSWASWQSANVTRGEETVRKASPLHSSNPEWWRTCSSIFSITLLKL